MSRYAKPYPPGHRLGHWVVVRYMGPGTTLNAKGVVVKLYEVVADCGRREIKAGHVLCVGKSIPSCNACKFTEDGKAAQQQAKALPSYEDRFAPEFVRCEHPLCGSPVRIGKEAEHTTDVHSRSEHAARFSEPLANEEDDGYDDEPLDEEEAREAYLTTATTGRSS